MEETYNVGERIHEVYMLKFKNALHKRVVEFQYKKKNGELRTAHGTLSEEFIGEDNMPKGTGIDVSDNVIRYYDIDSKGWRSFLIENFIDWTD